MRKLEGEDCCICGELKVLLDGHISEKTESFVCAECYQDHLLKYTGTLDERIDACLDE